MKRPVQLVSRVALDAPPAELEVWAEQLVRAILEHERQLAPQRDRMFYGPTNETP